MALNDNRRMPARLSAFVIWALVAASAVFWGLRLAVRSPQAPAYTVSVGEAASVGGDLTRLLGTPPAAAAATVATPEIAARFRLTGVMAPKPPATQGVALIAVDGKLPRAFRVGASIDGDLVLQSVSLRTAAIGQPVRRCRPVIRPSRGPGPKLAPIYMPVASANTPKPATNAGICCHRPSNCGTSHSPNAALGPINATLRSVPRPGI